MKPGRDIGELQRIPLPEPWEHLNGAQAHCALREVRIELAPNHALYHELLTPIARFRAADDFLFSLEDGRVAQVHLTWSEHVETPPWPSHRVYDGLDEWALRVMIPATGDSDS